MVGANDQNDWDDDIDIPHLSSGEGRTESESNQAKREDARPAEGESSRQKNRQPVEARYFFNCVAAVCAFSAKMPIGFSVAGRSAYCDSPTIMKGSLWIRRADERSNQP